MPSISRTSGACRISLTCVVSILSMPAISDLIDLIALDEIVVVSERDCAASARLRTSCCSFSLSSFLTLKSFSRSSLNSPRSMASASAVAPLRLFAVRPWLIPRPCRLASPGWRSCARSGSLFSSCAMRFSASTRPSMKPEQFLELAAHLQDFRQLRHLLGDLVGSEVPHVGEGQVERQLLVPLRALGLRAACS